MNALDKNLIEKIISLVCEERGIDLSKINSDQSQQLMGGVNLIAESAYEFISSFEVKS